MTVLIEPTTAILSLREPPAPPQKVVPAIKPGRFAPKYAEPGQPDPVEHQTDGAHEALFKHDTAVAESHKAIIQGQAAMALEDRVSAKTRLIDAAKGHKHAARQLTQLADQLDGEHKRKGAAGMARKLAVTHRDAAEKLEGAALGGSLLKARKAVETADRQARALSTTLNVKPRLPKPKEEKPQIEEGAVDTRNWAEWDLEHPWQKKGRPSPHEPDVDGPLRDEEWKKVAGRHGLTRIHASTYNKAAVEHFSQAKFGEHAGDADALRKTAEQHSRAVAKAKAEGRNHDAAVHLAAAHAYREAAKRASGGAPKASAADKRTLAKASPEQLHQLGRAIDSEVSKAEKEGVYSTEDAKKLHAEIADVHKQIREDIHSEHKLAYALKLAEIAAAVAITVATGGLAAPVLLGVLAGTAPGLASETTHFIVVARKHHQEMKGTRDDDLLRDWTEWDLEHPWEKKDRPHEPTETPVGRPRRGKPGVDYPIHTADVDEAARLLAEDKKVELDSPRQVGTLLDKLTDIVHDAVQRGEKAPNYNLCLVSVPHTNLFCASSKGIPRIKMPQLSGKPTPGSEADKLPKDAKGEVDLAPAFRAQLEAEGHHVTDTTESAAHLKASQDELNGSKVAGMVQSLRVGKLPPGRIFTSSDNYIVDGHHRWAANVGESLGSAKDMQMDVARVDMPIIDLLDEANKFTERMGIAHAARNTELLLRNWAKWHEEHPYIHHPRTKHGTALIDHPEIPDDDHAGGRYEDQDREVMEKAIEKASKMDPGVVHHGRNEMTDEEYAAHRNHVEYELTRHGSRDLERSPISTHNSEDRVDGVEGRYTEERQKLHDQIIREYEARAANVPKEHQAIIMGGLGGAGKSSILRHEAQSPDSVAGKLGIKYDTYDRKGEGVGEPNNFVTINPDDIKERMSELGAIPHVDELSPMEASPFTHEEASQLAERISQRLQSQGTNVIHDITLNSVKSGQKRILGDPARNVKGLRQQGYHTTGVMVDVSTAQSLRNAENRHRGGQDRFDKGIGFGGRYVPSDLIRGAVDPTGQYRSKNRAAFEELKRQGMFDHSLTIDNENFAGRLLSEAGRGETTMHTREDAPKPSPVTSAMQAYQAGQMSFPELTAVVVAQPFATPTYYTTPDRDMADAESQDWVQPGTWSEVVNGADQGYITDDELHQLDAAVSRRKQTRSIEPGALDVRDWAKWDAEHRGAGRLHRQAMRKSQHVLEAGGSARRFAEAAEAHRDAAEAFRQVGNSHTNAGEYEKAVEAFAAAHAHEAVARQLASIPQDRTYDQHEAAKLRGGRLKVMEAADRYRVVRARPTPTRPPRPKKPPAPAAAPKADRPRPARIPPSPITISTHSSVGIARPHHTHHISYAPPEVPAGSREDSDDPLALARVRAWLWES